MCIIAVKPSGVEMPDIETLRAMWDNNPDGAGFMYADGGNVNIFKGYMSFRTFHKALGRLEKRVDTKDTPIVLHFRIGTSGELAPSHTHPYPITSDLGLLFATHVETDVAIVHNGIINIEHPKELSDTMQWIGTELNLVRAFDDRWYDDDAACALIEKRTQSKFAVMTDDGSIYTIGRFYKIDGVSYSNHTYEPWDYGSYGWTKYEGWKLADSGDAYDPKGNVHDYDSNEYLETYDGKTKHEKRLMWLEPDEVYVIDENGVMDDACAYLVDFKGNLYKYGAAKDTVTLMPHLRQVSINGNYCTWASKAADWYRLEERRA